jgi:hypothetical protein
MLQVSAWMDVPGSDGRQHQSMPDDEQPELFF